MQINSFFSAFFDTIQESQGYYGKPTEEFYEENENQEEKGKEEDEEYSDLIIKQN